MFKYTHTHTNARALASYLARILLCVTCCYDMQAFQDMIERILLRAAARYLVLERR